MRTTWAGRTATATTGTLPHGTGCIQNLVAVALKRATKAGQSAVIELGGSAIGVV